jgi:glutamate-1-semialdehyde 2,1-aminomutase
VREETRKRGIILIFDEITIGWRTCFGGAHQRFGVNPDMALFAKALGNGHPIAAVIGTAAAMSGAHGSFISSAYWTEAVGPAAALATLDEMERLQVAAFVGRQGAKIAELLRSAAQRHGLPLAIKGYPCAPLLVFEHPQAQELKTLYIQLMLARGFLAGGLIYVTLAHDDATIARFAEGLDPVFGQLAQALAANDFATRLRGPVAHAGFKRLI